MINLFKKREDADESVDQEHEDESADTAPDLGDTPADTATDTETERQASVRELRAAASAARVRLVQGSLWLCQWYGARVGAWCKAGRRTDLDGLAAELGVWLRGGVLCALGYGAWRLVGAEPRVLWAVGGVWLLAAAHAEHPQVRAAKRQARAEAKARDVDDDEQLLDEYSGEDSGEDVDEAPDEGPLLALIRAEIGTDSAVHLQDLYPAMRAGLPGCSSDSDEVLRRVLDEHHIPVRRSTRARGVAGRSGVHRADLPPLPSPEGAPGGLSTPLSTHGDAGQARSGEHPGERRRGAGRAGKSTVRLVQDGENPARWHVRSRAS